MLSQKSAFHKFDLSVFLHFIARGLYAIFVPIILLKNNYSLNAVLLFVIFSALTVIASSFAAQKLLYHKRAIVFNILAVIAEIVLVIAFSLNYFSPLLFTLIFICDGLYYGFYYFSYYAIICHYSSQSSAGRNLGNANISLNIAWTIAPFLGAVLLGYGSIYLISIASAFLLLSLLPMLRLTKEDINGAELPKLDIGNAKIEFIEYGLLGAIDICIFVLWSIYAFQSGVSLALISTIAIGSGLANILISSEIKRYVTKLSIRKKLKFFAVFFISLLSLYRYFYPEHVLTANFLFGVAFLIFGLCVETELLMKIKGCQTYHSSAMMNIVSFSARALIALLAIFIGLKNMILAPIILSAIYLFITLRKSHSWLEFLPLLHDRASPTPRR